MTSALSWYERRTFRHGAFPAERLAADRRRTACVLLPARNEASTIGAVVEALLPLREHGIVEQIAVLDDSTDGTGAIAAAAGAEVHDQSALRPELGPVAGKGDAMWRGLTVARGDVVCFLDADTKDLGPHFALGLLGPLLLRDDIELVKGFYRRPARVEGRLLPDGGGRVTELMARPLLNRFFPELAGFLQPLAGEVAARRDLLEQLPFACGYGVDIGLLIDAARRVGVDALAQVDLDSRQNRHQPLAALGPMSAAVLAAVARRLEQDGRIDASPEPGYLAPAAAGGLEEQALMIDERPPAASLAVSAA